MSIRANGSQDLKWKIPIRTLTVVLFAIGGVIAAIAVYQQFTISSDLAKPYSISKDEATAIALYEVDFEPDRDASILPSKSADATLIYIGSEGRPILVDEDSLENIWAFQKDRRFQEHEDKYVWYVDVTTSNINGGSRTYWYLIDVDRGQIIEKGLDTS